MVLSFNFVEQDIDWDKLFLIFKEMVDDARESTAPQPIGQPRRWMVR